MTALLQGILQMIGNEMGLRFSNIRVSALVLCFLFTQLLAGEDGNPHIEQLFFRKLLLRLEYLRGTNLLGFMGGTTGKKKQASEDHHMAATALHKNTL